MPAPTLWKLPNENGLLVMSALSLFVGARTSQRTGAMKKIANTARIAIRAPRPSRRTPISPPS